MLFMRHFVVGGKFQIKRKILFKKNLFILNLDNIDTRSALDAIRDLVSNTNIYIRDHSTKLNSLLLRRIAEYITDILHIFGAINGPRGGIGFPVSGHSSDNV